MSVQPRTHPGARQAKGRGRDYTLGTVDGKERMGGSPSPQIFSLVLGRDVTPTPTVVSPFALPITQVSNDASMHWGPEPLLTCVWRT